MCIYKHSTSQTNNNFKGIAASQNKGKQLTIGKCVITMKWYSTLNYNCDKVLVILLCYIERHIGKS